MTWCSSQVSWRSNLYQQVNWVCCPVSFLSLQRLYREHMSRDYPFLKYHFYVLFLRSRIFWGSSLPVSLGMSFPVWVLRSPMNQFTIFFPPLTNMGSLSALSTSTLNCLGRQRPCTESLHVVGENFTASEMKMWGQRGCLGSSEKAEGPKEPFTPVLLSSLPLETAWGLAAD